MSQATKVLRFGTVRVRAPVWAIDVGGVEVARVTCIDSDTTKAMQWLRDYFTRGCDMHIATPRRSAGFVVEAKR